MAAAVAFPGVHKFEATSDDIDLVNVHKSKEVVGDTDIYRKSEFDKGKDTTTFRQFNDACDRVKSFYAQQHSLQTVAYNLKARKDFHANSRAEMTVWQALEKLDTFVDECDPDTQESQLTHLLQTAEALRQDGKPRWMQLVGLIHDLGKLLFFFGANGQWDVVGDNFPVGCAFDDRIIFGTESFKDNEDYDNDIYKTKFGIYSPGCGLDNVMLSWGHDEYLYHIVKDQSLIPDEGLAMIRYHSFYPWHREGAYRELMNEKDHAMLKAVLAFNPYDLYSKSEAPPKAEDLKLLQPYYTELIDEFFPSPVIRW
ncbi:inositol oxygenase 1 [Hortaea werneckii]|nr:inositol oxygenase 1 [Hortaea werneckii]KAI7026915.1 inositol oxygenase 1 [Hortaea werneckii]KAI7203258.1 inositol oxygenase 1 [Hortaea werneckii]KAI7594027.1 inositol oxygenase 1 [Hortaea werneckii]KAI7676032.1 inositol oxygenase 1 [Hortaea werneckii]